MVDLKDGLEHTLGAAYTVERELSGGGMSRVFVALDGSLGRRVVVKVLPPDLAASVSLERFKREILLAATLQHPHIVGVLSAGEIDGMPFFTMPFVEGESLRDRIQREGQLTVGRAVSILKDVARALAYAHERGVVHRDIKPDNVLLAGNSATVTDFGIAKALLGAVTTPRDDAREASGSISHSSLTQLGTTLGTPAYMAPEQAAADATTDHRADIYSFGIMAYEMLTGQVPFKSKTPQALLAAQLTATPAPIALKRADVPVALARLVMQCLEKEREKRPQSARELAELLEHPDMVSGAFASAPQLGVRRAPWRAIVATALLVAGIGAVWTWAIRKPAAAPTTQAAAVDRARAVVVLPFVNIGPDSTDAYLAEGITNGLINALGRVPGVRVTSRSVAASAREKFASATEIGAALKVGRVLEGTVQRDGTRIRVTARMTNADDGFMLWSDTFDREMKDVFAVQDEISSSIAEALGAQMVPAAAATSDRGTNDDTAYDMYLRGRHFFEQRGEAGLRRALQLFQDAAARDQKFARAHAGIAAVYSMLPMYAPVSAESLFVPGFAAATRAIELDSSLAEASASRASLLMSHWRWTDAEADYRRAIALDPAYAPAHQWYGEMLLLLGRTNEATQQLKRAADLEPVSPIIASSYSMALGVAGRDSDAVAQARRAVELDSALFLPRLVMGAADLHAGRLTEAARELEIALALNPNAPFVRGMLGFTYAKLGQRPNADRLLADLQRSRDANALVERAMIQIGVDDVDGGLTSLEAAVKRHAPFFSTSPLSITPFDAVRASPRFVAVLHAVGLR